MSTHPDRDSGAQPPLLFRIPIELRWSDLDLLGHANNAKFLTYIEEARIRWFKTVSEGWADGQTVPLLAAAQINYRLPITYPAHIHIEMYADRVGNSSLTIGHRIVGEDARLYADGHCVLVWIDRANGRPVALPDSIRAAATVSGSEGTFA